MKRDHEHGLPPEARRQSRQLARASEDLSALLGLLAAAVAILLGVVLVSRTPSAPRLSAEPAMEFPR